MAHKILIIDDEGLITKTLQKLLTKKGYEVVITSSGAEAIGAVFEHNFDLIISDVRMPELDGIETIERLRKIQLDRGKTPAKEIVITGFADEEQYKNAIKLKVADYIFKPFDTTQFLDTVKRNLDGK